MTTLLALVVLASSSVVAAAKASRGPWRTAVLVGVLTIHAGTAPAGPATTPIAKGEHPRLLLTSAALPALKAGLRGARSAGFNQFLAVIDAAYKSYGAADLHALRNL